MELGLSRKTVKKYVLEYLSAKSGGDETLVAYLKSEPSYKSAARENIWDSWYFENVMLLRVTRTKHTGLLPIGTQRILFRQFAFSGAAFCRDICKHSACFLPYEVGKHDFCFICVFSKDKEKMGMMDFYKNFEI